MATPSAISAGVVGHPRERRPQRHVSGSRRDPDDQEGDEDPESARRREADPQEDETEACSCAPLYRDPGGRQTALGLPRGHKARASSAIVSPSRVLTRPLDLAAYASDASFYTLMPAAVVRPKDTAEIKALCSWSRRERVPLTFRAAGTSLSGQAVGSGVIVDCSRHWRTLEISDGGARVRVGPGWWAGS